MTALPFLIMPPKGKAFRNSSLKTKKQTKNYIIFSKKAEGKEKKTKEEGIRYIVYIEVGCRKKA